jgi:NADH:ubiquinone oxidoreductase subunit C
MLSLKLIKNDWVNTIFFTFLKKIMEKAVEIVVYSTKSGVIVKAARGRVFGLLRFLRSHVLCQYKSLIDIITYDNPQTKYRFAVIYNLLSVAFNSRLLICTYTKKGLIPSVCSLYASAG